jgi:FkbM family methyltransferase
MRVRPRTLVRAAARRIPGLPRFYWLARQRVLLRRGVARLDYEHAPIHVRVTSRKIVGSRLFPVAKEPWTVAWIERSLGAGDVFYDIGANIGVYALIAAARLSSRGRVVAIEPAYANYTELCENIVLNAFQDVVLPLPVVLAERHRLGVLNYSTLDPGAALHELDGDREAAYRQPVLTYALDELIEWFELPVPTLIKLDVDGGESAVLAGSARTLARTELRSVLIEVDDAQTDSVLTTMSDAGFRLADRFDERQGEPLPGIWYGTFSRAD